MKVSEFDYDLPPELIAQVPVEPRDSSRLMVIDRLTGEIEHRIFKDIVNFLAAGDTLVLNNTRVIPARLFGEKQDTGAKIEVLLLKRLDLYRWETLIKPGKRIKPGMEIVFGPGDLRATALEITADGGRVLEFSWQGVFEEILDKLGKMPLPPYITAELANKERYQTVYSKVEGSSAAPTAGLHFTPELLEVIKRKGVNFTEVLLHVGLGTFRPVKVDDIREHNMHSEYYEVSPAAAEVINQTRKSGKRVIAVGTTAARTLESSVESNGEVRAGSGWTDIFIYPGYEFKVIDALLTNFHLPKSTLLMLISAFAGKDKMLHAYQIAVMERYRFFSFGDAMFIR